MTAACRGVPTVTRFDIEAFHSYVQKYRKQHPEQRYGQALMNCLWNIRPDLHALVMGTENDPFYNNRNIVGFVKFLTENP